MLSNFNNAVRVLIVDDQALMREGLQAVLDLEETIEVVGTAADGADALKQAERLRPDVILMDVRMPGLDGIAATRLLKERHARARVLVLTTYDDEESIDAALRAGASGYVLKDMPSDQLVRDIHAVYAGESSLSPRVARKLIVGLYARGENAVREDGARVSERPLDDEGREALSEREIEVLRLAADGLINREIGARLYLTEGTVKNYMSSILSKLQVRDRLQAILFAHEHDLL